MTRREFRISRRYVATARTSSRTGIRRSLYFAPFVVVSWHTGSTRPGDRAGQDDALHRRGTSSCLPGQCAVHLRANRFILGCAAGDQSQPRQQQRAAIHWRIASRTIDDKSPVEQNCSPDQSIRECGGWYQAGGDGSRAIPRRPSEVNHESPERGGVSMAAERVGAWVGTAQGSSRGRDCGRTARSSEVLLCNPYHHGVDDTQPECEEYRDGWNPR
jgi:hypothetical protein